MCRQLYTDDTTVKQAVEYILAQPDGKDYTLRFCETGLLTITPAH
jgi:hypothetical protein